MSLGSCEHLVWTCHRNRCRMFETRECHYLCCLESVLVSQWRESVVWNGCAECSPTSLTSSLDVDDSSLGPWVPLAAWRILSAAKGCHVTFLLSKVICATGSEVITFPGSTVSHHIASALPRTAGYVNVSVYSTTASIQPLPHTSFSYLVAHKLCLYVLRVYSLCCSPPGGLFPVRRSPILPRVSGINWIYAWAADQWHELHTVGQVASHSTENSLLLSFKRYPDTSCSLRRISIILLKKNNIASSKML